MARRGYPPEFRRRVVDLVEGGRKVSEVAAELEVGERWTARRARVALGSVPIVRRSTPRRGAGSSSLGK